VSPSMVSSTQQSSNYFGNDTPQSIAFEVISELISVVIDSEIVDNDEIVNND